MITLTLERTKQLLAEAVAEKGAEYVYVNRDGDPADGDVSVSCHYVHGDQPGCIVGWVLYRAGVGLADLSEYEGRGAEDPVEGLMEAPAEVRKLLNWAQDYQDQGTPWGEAVRRALSRLEQAG
jgi:hypothetical protein